MKANTIRQATSVSGVIPDSNVKTANTLLPAKASAPVKTIR